MTRVIHTGDTHLGYRQYHSPERRADFLAAFEEVIEDAIAEDVDAVIHAGDLFHDRNPSIGDVHGAIEVLRDLRDAGIPFLAIVGNHERTRDQQWLDLFETLGLATRLGRDPVEIGNAAFYGLDYVPKSKRDDLDYDFEDHDAEHAALVAHGLFEPFGYADWDTEEVIESATVEFDALLLGDNHKPDRAEVRDTWVTYCGSTERTEAGEREDRGYNIVEFSEGVSIRRRGLDTREFVFLDLELAPGEGAEYVRERIREADVEDAVVIVSIEGEGEEVPAARIEEFASDRGALIARVNDRREFESEEATEVRFVDPDEAVRDRLREMGPSEAALSLDETIRDTSIADSNVRERAVGHVRDLLEAGEDAFTTTGDVEAPEEENEDESSGGEAAEADADSDGGTTEAETGSDGEATEAETESDGEATEAEAEVETDGLGTGTDDRDSRESTAGESDGSDGQVTMEDYL